MDWFAGARPEEILTLVKTEWRKITCNFGIRHDMLCVTDAIQIRVIERVGRKTRAIDEFGRDWTLDRSGFDGHYSSWYNKDETYGKWAVYREDILDPDNILG